MRSTTYFILKRGGASSIGVGPIAEENRAERGLQVLLEGPRPSQEKGAPVPPACVQVGFQRSRAGIEHSHAEQNFRAALPEHGRKVEADERAELFDAEKNDLSMS